jgi:hypothetical protein
MAPKKLKAVFREEKKNETGFKIQHFLAELRDRKRKIIKILFSLLSRFFKNVFVLLTIF